MRAMYGVLLAVILAAPTTAFAQNRGAAPPGGMRERMGNPVGMLLERSADLGLTDSQVTRIQAISTQLEQNNRSIMERMQELRGDSGSDRRQMMETLQPLMESMQQNNQNAMAEVRGILSSEQQAKVDEVMRERPGGPGGRMRDGRDGDRRGPPPGDRQ